MNHPMHCLCNECAPARAQEAISELQQVRALVAQVVSEMRIDNPRDYYGVPWVDRLSAALASPSAVVIEQQTDQQP